MTPEERAAQRQDYLRQVTAMLEDLMVQMQQAADLAASNRAWRKANGETTTTQGSSTTSETTASMESESSSSTSAGFYRVVRNGVHFFAFTNGMVLSNTVNVAVEAGW